MSDSKEFAGIETAPKKSDGIDREEEEVERRKIASKFQRLMKEDEKALGIAPSFSKFYTESSHSSASSGSTQSRYAEDFQQIKLLGRGGFGWVYECKHRIDDMKYAVKIIPFSDEQLTEVLREVKVLAAVQHAGVIRYYQCWTEDSVPTFPPSSEDEDIATEATKTLYIAMELCEGTLHDKLRLQSIDDTTAWRYSKQLLEGLRNIHENGVIHGDISRDNIFFDSRGDAKIGDFGLAQFTREMNLVENMFSVGNRMYRAPEVDQRLSSISAKSDMYAMGLVLFEMHRPFENVQERARVLGEVKRSKQLLLQEMKKASFSPYIQQVIGPLLEKDPTQRPSAAELLQLM